MPTFWLFPIALALAAIGGFAFTQGQYLISVVVTSAAWYILGLRHGFNMAPKYNV